MNRAGFDMVKIKKSEKRKIQISSEWRETIWKRNPLECESNRCFKVWTALVPSGVLVFFGLWDFPDDFIVI